MKTSNSNFKWYFSGLLLSVALLFSSCDRDEVNETCLFIAFLSGGETTFDECRADFFSDGAFYLFGEAAEGNIELGDWHDETGTQSTDPQGAYAAFTDAAGMVYSATSGTLEFTKINKDNKILDGKYDFKMESSSGETMDLKGSFSNVPFVEK